MKITNGFMILEHMEQHSCHGIWGDRLFQNGLNLLLAIQTGILMRRAHLSAQIEATTPYTLSRGALAPHRYDVNACEITGRTKSGRERAQLLRPSSDYNTSRQQQFDMKTGKGHLL